MSDGDRMLRDMRLGVKISYWHMEELKKAIQARRDRQ